MADKPHLTGGDDLLNVYLVEMAQEPLLIPEEEVTLAEHVQRGRQARRALDKAGCSAEEAARLDAQVKVGQAARERLGRANTRLVISIAKRYSGYGLPLSDLIQDGNEGLMRAVDRYDPRRGYRFSTYATWWIRQAITRSLSNHGRTIRLPVYVGERTRKMALVAQRLELTQGRPPTTAEIATEMGESTADVRKLMRWCRRPLSLDSPVGEDDVELGDFLEEDSVLQAEEQTDLYLLRRALKHLLNRLSSREVYVLGLRYGLQDGQSRTLQEVADKLGLTRERIRQIEKEALIKLRTMGGKHRLEDFLKVSESW